MLRPKNDTFETPLTGTNTKSLVPFKVTEAPAPAAKYTIAVPELGGANTGVASVDK